ncbi:Cytochrome c554 and c-prime [Candidatus Electronema halotolerans]
MKCRLIFSAVLLSCCWLPQAQAHELPEKAVPLEQSNQCAGCHATIYQEWQESFHALSSVHKDSAHKAVHQAFVKAMKAQGKQGNYHCGSCHAPMSDNLAELMAGQAEPDSSNWTQAEGVGCTFCHRIEAVVEQKPFSRYRLNQDGAFHTSRPANPEALHKTAQSSLFGDGQVCMGCHSHLFNGKNVAVCAMSEEGQSNCITCHMPAVPGGAVLLFASRDTHLSHRMTGGHDLEMLKKAVSVEAKIQAEGKQQAVAITVKNIIEHSFPSTNPMRMAFVKVTAKDKAGKVLWTNFKDSPLEDKKALFFKAFKAGEQSGVPTWAAETVAFDTRLKAGETRSLTYPLADPAITEVEVALIYRLFPPAAIEGFAIPKDGVNDKVYPIFKKTLPVGKGGKSGGECWKKVSKTLTFDYYIKSEQCDE